jgi:hypothetical protein
MAERNVLDRLDRVKAPAGFEARVLAELSLRKPRGFGARRLAAFAYAGSAAAVLAAFVIVGGLFLRRPEAARASRDDRAIPVTETVDYSSEVRNASYEPSTIYILEQVSEASSSGISY